MSGDAYVRVPVHLDGSEYDILIGRNVLGDLGPALASKTRDRQVLIFYDANLKGMVDGKIIPSLRESGFVLHEHSVAGGKISKTIYEALKLYGIMEHARFARDSTVVAIGGGVIGDMGGFVSSTFFRGVNLVHVPTTLMAMIDSSVGGKTAVNFRKTINAIGTYYHPRINAMDLSLLDTLPERELISGIAEALKAGFIADKEFVSFLDSNAVSILRRSPEELRAMIRRAIEIKLDHVTGDVREGGKRLKLNYGHTLGHAIEVSTETDAGETLRHGEGVAIGMVAAAFVARKHLSLGGSVYDRQAALINRFGLPCTFSASQWGFSRAELIEECMRNVVRDKKRKDEVIRMILVPEIGMSTIAADVSADLIREAFRHVILD